MPSLTNNCTGLIPSLPAIPAYPEKCRDFAFSAIDSTEYFTGKPIGLKEMIRAYLHENNCFWELTRCFNSIIAHCVAIGDIKCARSWVFFRNQIIPQHVYPMAIYESETDTKVEPYKEEF